MSADGVSAPTDQRDTLNGAIAHSAQKRQLEDAKKAGLGGQQTSGSDSPAPGEARARPVFKMRRTGHSGPFPLSGRPVQAAAVTPIAGSAGSGIGNHDTPSPSVSSVVNVVSKPLPGKHSARPIAESGLANSFVDLTTATHLSDNGGTEDTVPAAATMEFSATPATSGLQQKLAKTSGSSTPELLKTPIPPDVQAIFDVALDDKPYRLWTDESGQQLSTVGALLPQGYQKSDNTLLPWVCPVRSCRKLLPSIHGLGRHTCNAHRAAMFNDNLDGTFTEIGHYADPTNGNGRHSGGFAKPAVILTRREMTLAESPMVVPRARTGVIRSSMQSTSTVPQRGGPRRRLAMAEPTMEVSESTDAEDEPAASTPIAPSSTTADQRFEMANPDRKYNMWHAEGGGFIPAFGALIPEKYQHDTTMADRPWICPVRTCRRLFKSLLDMGNHFRGHHRGSRLNDNLDGTFSVVGKPNGTASAVVISRDSNNSQPISEPMRPIYPHGKGSSTVRWVPAVDDDSMKEKPATEVRSDDGEDVDAPQENFLDQATDGRPYNKWWESGEPLDMGGALIPAGYELDNTFPDCPWICPVRSCRVACKSRNGLGLHFTFDHPFSKLNDNEDGTFSVVGALDGEEPRVVSRQPLDPNEPPMAAPSLPPDIFDTPNERKMRRAAAKKALLGLSSTANSALSARASPALTALDATRLWDYIRGRAAVHFPIPPEPALRFLLRQPRLRGLHVTHPIVTDGLGPKHMAGLIIQIVGQQNDNPCSECRRHDGPLDPCVSLNADMAKEVYGFLSSSARACGNCLVRKNASACSVRKLGSAWERLSKQDLEISRASIGAAADTIVDTDLGEFVLGRRRSTRLTLANGREEASAEEDGSADEAPYRPGATRVTSRNADRGVRSTRRSRESRGLATSWMVNPPTEADLYMEDWEMDDGRINSANEPLAFSSTYLAANQMVQVTPTVSFQTAAIPSGGLHRFSADSARTRICTLSGSGKLRVQVGAEPEFSIGSQGVFKIVPGVACAVTNRCYADVVLHVTSLPRG